MALRRWDLVRSERPALTLAPPGPRRHPVGAALFVLVLLVVLAAPVLRAAERSAVPRERPRALPASALAGLDPLPPPAEAGRPRSSAPVGGMAFVRCTHLWVAEPDGSNAHRILDAPGISSPTFAPDARTLAFFVSGENGPELWTAAADGSSSRRSGALTSDGWPIHAQPAGLTWSPDGKELAFALTSPDYGPFEGGSSLWRLDLATGSFARAGAGWPQPFWFDGGLAYASWDEDRADAYFTGTASRAKLHRMSDGGGALSAAVVPEGWSSLRPSYQAVVLRRDIPRRSRLVLKRSAGMPRPGVSVSAPDGWDVPRFARPTLSQDGSRASVSLVDGDGAPALGILDTATTTWTVLAYAWQPSASPAPPGEGSMGRTRARAAADELMSDWNRRGARAGLLLGGRYRRSRIALRSFQFTTGRPVKTRPGWRVPVTVYGKLAGGYASQDLAVNVRTDAGRIVARPVHVQPSRPVETVADAVRLLDSILTVPVMAPSNLPAGTTLASDRTSLPIDAWSWDRATTGSLQLDLPGRDKTMRIYYGNAYFNSCGDAGGNPVTVGGGPALEAGDGHGVHQVVWPATLRSYQRSAPDYSVWATLPRDQVLSLAESMASKL